MGNCIHAATTYWLTIGMRCHHLLSGGYQVKEYPVKLADRLDWESVAVTLPAGIAAG